MVVICCIPLLVIFRLYRTVLRKLRRKRSWFWKMCLQISDLGFWQTRQVSILLLLFIVLYIHVPSLLCFTMTLWIIKNGKSCKLHTLLCVMSIQPMVNFISSRLVFLIGDIVINPVFGYYFCLFMVIVYNFLSLPVTSYKMCLEACAFFVGLDLPSCYSEFLLVHPNIYGLMQFLMLPVAIIYL